MSGAPPLAWIWPWPWPWALQLLLIAPVLEEIVWRAGLQEFLLRHTPLPPAWSTACTALLFALAHGLRTPDSPWAWLTVLPGWGIGWLYQRRRRLWPCVAAHAGLNALWLALAPSA